ncbi:MAG: hypothetical protein ACJ76Z_10100 [Thermoleophilaceae bacterium]
MAGDGSFDEATVRERLKAAPRVSSPTPKLIRIDRAALLDTEEESERQGELEEAARAVVEKLGGRLGKLSERHQGRRAGRMVAEPPTVVWFYELPAGALDE